MKDMMVMIMKVTVALVAEYQNLNSGKRLERTRMKFCIAQRFGFNLNFCTIPPSPKKRERDVYLDFVQWSRFLPDEWAELFILRCWQSRRSI